jgi:hypothetical protein
MNRQIFVDTSFNNQYDNDERDDLVTYVENKINKINCKNKAERYLNILCKLVF